MEELHRTHKPVEFGWLKLVQEWRRSPRRSALLASTSRGVPAACAAR